MRLFTLIFLLVLNITLCISTTQSAQIKALRQRFTNDIQRLNNKLNQLKQNPAITIQLSSISTQLTQQIQTIKLHQQNIQVKPNQLVQLNLQNIPNLNIIDAKIKPNQNQQSSLNNQRNSQQKQQQQSNENYCKFIDPQLIVTIQHKLSASFYSSKSLQLHYKPQYILFKTTQEKYRLLIVDNFKIALYDIIIDLDNKYVSRSNIAQLHMNYLSEVFNQINQQFKYFDVELFLLEGNKKILFYQNKLYQVIVSGDQFNVTLYSQIQANQKQFQKNNQQDQPNKQVPQQIEKIIPLKFGFLIQYKKSIQIYLQSQQPNLQINHKTFTPRLSQSQLQLLTKNQTIISVQFKSNPSQNSGYQIFILLESQSLIQLQYGAFTHIFLYNISYGQRFLDLTISPTFNKDIVEIIFQLNRGKMTENYILQIFINRQQNPLKPSAFVNRFYDDMTNVRDIEFLNNQLILIGQFQTIILDYPINSQILIKQRIQSHPYHFASDNLLALQVLQESQKQSAILLIESTDLTILKMNRKKQSIQCRPQDSLNTNIEILAYCPNLSTKNQQSASVCKYTTNLNISVSDQQFITLQQYKRYLIITLIIVLFILICVLLKQLINNKNIINKLKRIKSSILDKKQKQLKEKGQKIQGSQKFAQLQQEIQSQTNKQG